MITASVMKGLNTKYFETKVSAKQKVSNSVNAQGIFKILFTNWILRVSTKNIFWKNRASFCSAEAFAQKAFIKAYPLTIWNLPSFNVLTVKIKLWNFSYSSLKENIYLNGYIIFNWKPFGNKLSSLLDFQGLLEFHPLLKYLQQYKT